MTQASIFHSVLYVCLMGVPNAGKSTLMNSLTAHKASIVTDKPQTTRTTIMGSISLDRKTLVFMDAPGLFRPSKSMERLIVREAVAAVREADVLLLIVDHQKSNLAQYKDILQIASSAGKPVILAVNKVDIANDPASLSVLVDNMQKAVVLDEVFYISALVGSGLKQLLDKLYSMDARDRSLPPPTSARFYSCEITREHLFNALRQELPYSLAVAVEDWEESEDAIKIRQVIYVSSAKHKPIVIGKDGSMLKKIGISARQELTLMFGKEVSLFLHVLVRDKWQDTSYASLLIKEGRIAD